MPAGPGPLNVAAVYPAPTRQRLAGGSFGPVRRRDAAVTVAPTRRADSESAAGQACALNLNLKVRPDSEAPDFQFLESRPVPAQAAAAESLAGVAFRVSGSVSLSIESAIIVM